MEYHTLYQKVKSAIDKCFLDREDPEEVKLYTQTVRQSHSLRLTDFLFEQGLTPCRFVFSLIDRYRWRVIVYTTNGSIYHNDLTPFLGRNDFVAGIKRRK